MPKTPSSQASLFKNWISKFEDGVYTSDGKVIFCQACQQQAPSSKYFALDQHNGSAKHQANLRRFIDSKKRHLQQQLLIPLVQDKFTADLCSAFVGANIPFSKLNSPIFKAFMEKYCNRNMPDESTVRKNYLPSCYQETMSRIKDEIGPNGYIWASVDETVDKMGRQMANLLVGLLDGLKWHAPHLISCKQLLDENGVPKVNHETVARFVDEGLSDLLSTGQKKARLLLLLTDGVAYMKKSAKGLKLLYCKMLHVTCLCHGLHRVAEKVRDSFPAIDQLIGSTKIIFSKAPLRVATYKQMTQALPLPPKPILTRWGTWLEACQFYTQNYEAVKAVVDSFNSEDAACILTSQTAFKDQTICHDLAYIQSNFGDLVPAIAKLETQGLTINESSLILGQVQEALNGAAGEHGETIRQKFRDVLSKNPDIDAISKIGRILSGEVVDFDMTPNIISLYKYAPLTSCDVERSFSSYKNILADNRCSFTPEHFEMYIICNCEKRS